MHSSVFSLMWELKLLCWGMAAAADALQVCISMMIEATSSAAAAACPLRTNKQKSCFGFDSEVTEASSLCKAG